MMTPKGFTTTNTINNIHGRHRQAIGAVFLYGPLFKNQVMKIPVRIKNLLKGDIFEMDGVLWRVRYVNDKEFVICYKDKSNSNVDRRGRNSNQFVYLILENEEAKPVVQFIEKKSTGISNKTYGQIKKYHQIRTA